MKKMVANCLKAVLVVLLSVCFESCGSDVSKDPVSDSDNDNDSNSNSSAHGGGISEFLWGNAGKTLGASFMDGTTVTINVSDDVTVTFYSGDGSLPVYDTVMIQGASSAFSDPSAANNQVVFHGDNSNLPETATAWAVDFTKSSDPSVFFSFTIPAEYTSKVLAALE